MTLDETKHVKENLQWENIRKTCNWNMIKPSTEDYIVNVFDDGNNHYMVYVNEWYIYGTWKGKLALVNKFDSAIQIPSISCWKVQKK